MKLIRVILPIAIIVLGVGAMKTVTALGDTAEENESVDTRPTVQVTQLKPESFAINIEAFGELAPLESTRLAAQVSGEVVEWNPNFVAGV